MSNSEFILYIVWTDKNNTGIPIIDEQHRSIVAAINSLYYFLQEGHGHELLKAILTTLQQYVDIHFTTEETLMEKANYPHLNEHVILHRELMDQTKNVAHESLLNNDANIVLSFLKGWWLGHINKEDQRYVPHMLKNR